jgi:hypothetical protein
VAVNNLDLYSEEANKEVALEVYAEKICVYVAVSSPEGRKKS